jgi:hypothetical protein
LGILFKRWQAAEFGVIALRVVLQVGLAQPLGEAMAAARSASPAGRHRCADSNQSRAQPKNQSGGHEEQADLVTFVKYYRKNVTIPFPKQNTRASALEYLAKPYPESKTAATNGRF